MQDTPSLTSPPFLAKILEKPSLENVGSKYALNIFESTS